MWLLLAASCTGHAMEQDRNGKLVENNEFSAPDSYSDRYSGWNYRMANPANDIPGCMSHQLNFLRQSGCERELARTRMKHLCSSSLSVCCMLLRRQP